MSVQCQIVIGPSHSGKSKYCEFTAKYYEKSKVNTCIINLDPFAIDLPYQCYADVREFLNNEDSEDALVIDSDKDVIELIEYVIVDSKWLVDIVEEATSEGEVEVILFDCPGQMELYVSNTAFHILTKNLTNMGLESCLVFTADSQLLLNPFDWCSLVMMVLAVSNIIETKVLTVCTKVDLLDEDLKNQIETYQDESKIVTSLRNYFSKMPTFHPAEICSGSLDDIFHQDSFLFHDISDEESIENIQLYIESILSPRDNPEADSEDKIN